MVNPTTIYSSLQNLPFNTLIGNITSTTEIINLATLPAGNYEIKLGGASGSGAGTAVRELAVNGIRFLIFAAGTTYQETTIILRSAGPVVIQQINSLEETNPPLAYNIAYRRTPSLELLSLAELNQMNQELEHMQEIIKDNEILTDEQLDEIKQLHEKHTSTEQKRASKGVKNA